MQTIYTPWACLLSMEQLYYYSGGGRGCQGVGGNISGSLRGIEGLVRVLGGVVQGEGRRPGDAEHRRRRAEPAEPPGGRRPAAVFCGFCGFGVGTGVFLGSRCRFSEGWCRGGPQARRCEASPTAGGARRAARRAAACGRILRVLQILMWGQSSSTGTVLPSVRMTLTRLGRQMACSPSLASQPFLMHTWSGQSLVIKAMR